MKIKVGDRIRKLREGKDLTQENVADELGITHGAYSKIERGESDPNTHRLEQIAKILKVSIADFFDSSSTLKEEIGKYGYATKQEVENLGMLVGSLAKEIEKLRRDLAEPKPPTKKKRKK